MNKGLLIVVSGPSGVGKGTVLNVIMGEDDNLAYSVSCTTREPRPGDIDGVQYHFITKEQFEDNIKNGKMLEYAVYCDNYYGTGADYVESKRKDGFDVILEIDTVGARQVMDKCDDAVTVFIAPPSVSELENRLRNRGTEDDATIQKRLEKAQEELKHMDEYDYVIVNDSVEDAANKIKSIILSKRILNNKKDIIRGVLK